MPKERNAIFVREKKVELVGEEFKCPKCKGRGSIVENLTYYLWEVRGNRPTDIFSVKIVVDSLKTYVIYNAVGGAICPEESCFATLHEALEECEVRNEKIHKKHNKIKIHNEKNN